MNETPVTVVGNLTDAPDLRYTANGVAMAKFTVASTPRVFDRTSGTYRDGDPLFLACTAWRELAEHAAESLLMRSSRGEYPGWVGDLRDRHVHDSAV